MALQRIYRILSGVGGTVTRGIGALVNYIFFPPDFSDDPTDPSTLLTYSTKTTTDQVGDTVAPAGWSRKGRFWNFDGSGDGVTTEYTKDIDGFGCYFILDALSSNFRPLVIKDISFGVATVGVNIHVETTGEIFANIDDGVVLYKTLGYTPAIGSVHKYEAVFTSDTLELWIDNIMFSSVDITGHLGFQNTVPVTFGNTTDLTRPISGRLWGGFVSSGGVTETFYAANANATSTDGGYIIGNRGTVGTISTTDIGAFLGESTDPDIGDDLNTLGFSIGTGIYDGQFIPPHADNPNLDAFGNPLQYRPRLKYDLELVDSPCLDFDGVGDWVNLSRAIETSGDFEFVFYADVVDGGSGYQMFACSDTGNYWVGYNFGLSRYAIASTDNVFYVFAVPEQSGVHTFKRAGNELTLTLQDGTSISNTVLSTDVFRFKWIARNYYATRLIGRMYGLKLTTNGQTYTLPFSEVTGSQVYSKETDSNGDPLITGAITTADLNAIRSGRQPEYHYQIDNGWWDAGDGVYYPFNKDGTSTWHPPGILNGAYVSYQKPQSPQVIRADQTANVAGTGPVWFDALGNQNKLTESYIRAVYNYNMQGYICGQDIWDYTDKLNAPQDIESKTYSACYYTYDLMSDGGLLLADGIQLVNTSITE